LFGAGYLATFQNDYQQAMTLCEQSLALYRELGDRRGIAAALFMVAMTIGDQGDIAGAEALVEESLALRRALGDEEGIASSLHLLGEFASAEGDYDRAQRLLQESLTFRREHGDACGRRPRKSTHRAARAHEVGTSGWV
jgi:tetratricopeptide (TPR) repeat protein